MSKIDKTAVIKMAKHIFKRSAGVPDKRLMHPRREWSIALLLFAVILVSGSAYTATSFNRFRDLDTGNGEANVSVSKYRESLVLEVLDDYSSRTQAYEQLTKTLPVMSVVEVSSSTASSSDAVMSEETAGVENEIELESIEETGSEPESN